MSTAVAGIVENVKLTGAPALRQLPRGIKRAADVVAAVDQDAGNAVQCRGITEQLVLPEEGGVSPVVRDQAREPEAKFRIFVARIREMAGGEGDVRIFPGAPLPCRVIADRGIGVKQQRGVRTASGRCRNVSGTAVANRFHSRGKMRPTSRVIHSTSRRDVVVTSASTNASTRRECAWA